MLLGMTMRIISQSSKETPEEEDLWLRSCCSGWQLAQQQEVGSDRQARQMFSWAPPSGGELLVPLLFPSHPASEHQRCIFIRTSRALGREKASATYGKPGGQCKPGPTLGLKREKSCSRFFSGREFVDRVKGSHLITACSSEGRKWWQIGAFSNN